MASSRLKRKAADDDTLQSNNLNESFVRYGTPLPSLASTKKDKGEYVPLWQQVSTMLEHFCMLPSTLPFLLYNRKFVMSKVEEGYTAHSPAVSVRDTSTRSVAKKGGSLLRLSRAKMPKARSALSSVLKTLWMKRI